MDTAVYSTSDLRRLNRRRVYMALYEAERAMTKQDLVHALSMSLPTVSQNIKELQYDGLIDDSAIAPSTGGRKPKAFIAKAAARFAIGIEVSRDTLRFIAVDLKLQELGYLELQHPFRYAADYARDLAARLESFMDDNSLDRSRLLGVGIAIPGVFDPDEGVMISAPTLGLQDAPFAFLFREIPYPIFLENDGTCGGDAEWWTRKKPEQIVYLSLSRGIGGAFVMDGKSYSGIHRQACEFAHSTLHANGRNCLCGRRGCVEAYCSIATLSDELGCSLGEFFDRLKAGERHFREIWESYLDDLAIVLGNIHMYLDCDIVLGGRLSPYLEDRLEELNRRLSTRRSPMDRASYVTLCCFHQKAGCIGAALHFIREFLERQ